MPCPATAQTARWLPTDVHPRKPGAAPRRRTRRRRTLGAAWGRWTVAAGVAGKLALLRGGRGARARPHCGMRLDASTRGWRACECVTRDLLGIRAPARAALSLKITAQPIRRVCCAMPRCDSASGVQEQAAALLKYEPSRRADDGFEYAACIGQIPQNLPFSWQFQHPPSREMLCEIHAQVRILPSAHNSSQRTWPSVVSGYSRS